jgi:hypothetical protein
MKLSLSLVVFTFLTMSGAQANELPIRKSGLWEMVNRGANNAPALTSKQCVDSQMERSVGYDWLNPPGMTCERSPIERSADNISFRSTCKSPSAVTKSLITITGGYMEESYKVVVNSTTEPAPAPQMKNSTTTVNATFKGECPPGMVPGDLTTAIPGMKGQSTPKMNVYQSQMK